MKGGIIAFCFGCVVVHPAVVAEIKPVRMNEFHASGHLVCSLAVLAAERTTNILFVSRGFSYSAHTGDGSKRVVHKALDVRILVVGMLVSGALVSGM